MSSAGSAVTLGQSDHPLRREQMWVAARTDWDLRYELRLTRYLEPGGCCSVSRHLDVVGDVQEKRGFYATEMHAHLAQALERPKEIWWGWEDLHSQVLPCSTWVSQHISIGACKLLPCLHLIPTFRA